MSRICIPDHEYGQRVQKAAAILRREGLDALIVNGSGGYFPYSQAYEEGGYEVLTSSFGPGTDDILVTGMEDLLARIK